MHVVVVVHERPDDPPRAAQAGVRADVDGHRAGADEALQQIRGEAAVDLRDARGLERPAVAARVVDVGVESVLVREVPEAAEVRAEWPAVLQ